MCTSYVPTDSTTHPPQWNLKVPSVAIENLTPWRCTPTQAPTLSVNVLVDHTKALTLRPPARGGTGTVNMSLRPSESHFGQSSAATSHASAMPSMSEMVSTRHFVFDASFHALRTFLMTASVGGGMASRLASGSAEHDPMMVRACLLFMTSTYTLFFSLGSRTSDALGPSMVECWMRLSNILHFVARAPVTGHGVSMGTTLTTLEQFS